MVRTRAVPMVVLVLIPALLLAAAFPAAARSPQEEKLATAFRGPNGAIRHTGPRIVRPPAIVPLDHWSYPLLSRLVARGIIDLDLTTLPVSRREVLDALPELDEGRQDAGDVRGANLQGLTSRERWIIQRLAAEFGRAAVDTPAARLREGEAQLGVGLAISLTGDYVGADARDGGGAVVPAGGDTISLPSLDDEFSINAAVRYEVWGGFGEDIGFYTDATVTFHGQEGERIEFASDRARAWRGITADIVHGYVIVERPHWRVTAGRSGAAWGRSQQGRLLLSGNAPTLDGVEARASIGPLSFVSLNAMLEYATTGTESDLGVDEHVFLAGHRLVIAGPDLSVALNEAVVYSGVIPDPVYLNPFVPYYVSQHNERADDNILWSLDVDWRPLPGHELYTELLADDLQYDRNTNNPDKYAATFGYQYAGALFGGNDIELTVEYSHVRKWVYTHKHIEHRLEHDGMPLGFALGPDSDRLIAEAIIHPRCCLAVGVRYEHARKGEGSIRLPYLKGVDDPDTAFPSGDVQAVDSVRFSLEYDDLDGFQAGIGAGFYRVDGGDVADDSILEVTGHVGFRI